VALPPGTAADRIPEDPEERAAWLERWAAQQRERMVDRDPVRTRLRRRIAAFVEEQVELLDPIFDRKLDTASNIYFPASENAGVLYVAGATPWHVLPRALRKISASADDVFVEYGCGKGRVVHQAARWPLKRVIGVEIRPEVADFAKKLVVAHQGEYRCPSVEIVTGDAAAFRVPDDATIAYHAYGLGESMVDAVLRNLIQSIERRPRRVRLIYHRPTRGTEQVLDTGRFRLVPEMSFGSTSIFESYG